MNQSNQLKSLKKPTIHNVWLLLNHFKNRCKRQNWKISEHEDWIRTEDGKYHNFLWIQSLHASTFNRVCSDFKVAIKNNVSYQVKNVSYIAWLFLQSPPKELIQKVEKNIRYSKKIAIYDLSQTFTKTLLCRKLNKTQSNVFKEFEKFIEDELGIRIKANDSNQKKELMNWFPSLN